VNDDSCGTQARAIQTGTITLIILVAVVVAGATRQANKQRSTLLPLQLPSGNDRQDEKYFLAWLFPIKKEA